MNFQVRVSISVIFAILLFSTGCGTNTSTPAKQLVTDVYAAGSIADHTTGTFSAVYWKNGVAVSLGSQ